MKITIFDEPIDVKDDYLRVESLLFLMDNPRVYACIQGDADFDGLTDEEKQERIYHRLKDERSVANLVREVERHKGLMEPILVRLDTRQVIEGNSRLAVYRMLQERHPGDELWELIPCYMVSSLTTEQQAAFLSQIHVKGKTPWSAYAKANYAYLRRLEGWELARIAHVFGESQTTIRRRVKVIEMMERNGDNQQSHFSFYDAIVRTPIIAKEMSNDSGFRDSVLQKMRSLGSSEEDFTAQELRDRLPTVLSKPKIKKKFVGGEISLDEAFQRAKISDVEERVKQAIVLLDDITDQEVAHLHTSEVNALRQSIKKLGRELDRIKRMVGLI